MRANAIAVTFLVGGLCAAVLVLRSQLSQTPPVPTSSQGPSNSPVHRTESATSNTPAAASRVNPLPTPPDNDRASQIVAKLAAALESPSVVDYLISTGLSREDSQRIAAAGGLEMAMCQLDAMRELAAAQSVPFESVLDEFAIDTLPEFDLVVSALPPALDFRAVIQRAAPCLMNAQQRMGVPISSLELFPRGSTQ